MSGICCDDSVMILPTPGQSFAWRTVDGRPALVCEPLDPYASHLFTTSAWRLGSRAVSSTDDGWREVADALGCDDARLVRARQVHGVDVVVGVAASAHGELPQGDIILVRDTTAAAAVQVADCVPMLAVDRVTRAVAAVHAGWRGLAARAPQAGVAALAQTFGARPADLLVALGPSIGACCYEVGDEVRARFAHAGFTDAQAARWFTRHPTDSADNPTWPEVLKRPRRDGHWFFDGWAAVREQIIEAGVPPGQVYGPALCTASHPGLFNSYRRDGAPAGRLAGAIRGRST